jgi:hypothetical protein
MKRERKARRIYEKYHSVTLPKEMEVHHIIPVHAGGTNDPSNLIAITKEKHKEEHLKRYEETKDFRDLCAYHMIGYNFTEAHKISSSEGGKIGGNKVKKLGVGICSADKKKRSEWASLGGKAGGKVQYEKKLGIHKQTKAERLAFASSGGKVGAFTKSEIQSALGKRGGKNNKGFVWLTDGIISIKYSKSKQRIKSTNQFLKENPTFRKGKTEIKQKCLKCGKIMNARAIGRYHNERCKNNDKD